jgi:hypothetical protein
MPDLRYVIVPLIYRNLTPEESLRQTEPVLGDIVRELTINPTSSRTDGKVQQAAVERFEGEDGLDAWHKMNREFMNRDWGDGFPLVPPTKQKIEAMLRGTNLPPDYVVCDLPPGFGIATVEKIAINSVMAGAEPLHMPVIIAAVKAASQLPPTSAKGFFMSTSANGSFFVVNGPIAKELGVNAKAACLGPGRQNRVNLAIGRAYTLCLKNIGYWYPGQMDMDTIGSTRKFTPVIAENEEMSPWDPYHVDMGFKREESTVTFFGTLGELEAGDQGNTSAEGLLKNIAYTASVGHFDFPTAKRSGASATLVLLPPDVARPVGRAGFSKGGVKEFLHFHAQGSLGKMAQYMPLTDARVPAHWRWLLELSEEERLKITMPVRHSAEDYHIVVAGADRAKTLMFMCNPGRPITVGVDQFRAKP